MGWTLQGLPPPPLDWAKSPSFSFFLLDGFPFRKFLPWDFLLWDEISSCDRKILPVTGNFFLWQKILSCDGKYHPATGNFFPWQDITASDRKFLSVTENFFLRQEISSCGKKFLPLKRLFFLWQEISSCGNWLLAVPRCFFLWQENIPFMLCVIWRIPFFDKKFLPVVINHLLCQEVSSCDKKILPACYVW